MDKFRVAFTSDFFDDDGALRYANYNISAVTEHPDIETRALTNPDHVDGDELEGIDALFASPGGAAIMAASFHPDGRLCVITRTGVGYDDVDLGACTANHVALATAAEAVRRPTAVGTVTLRRALTTRLIQKDQLSRLGPDGWRRLGQYTGTGLVGRTLGVVGLGRVGAELVRLAAPLDMRVIAHDPYADRALAEKLGVRLVELDGLLAEADIVSLHCPLMPETRGLIDARRLALMKPTAFLINAARGGVVDQAALTETLRERRIAGAGLDVLAKEPADADDPLLTLDNVVLSGHALNGTDQLWAGFAETNVKAVLDVMHGRVPDSVANREVLETEQWRRKLVAHRARFGAGD